MGKIEGYPQIMAAKKTYFNWSSGKDASMALYQMIQNDQFNIDKLLTSVNAHHDRVSMHGLRRELLIKQAEAIGISLDLIELPEEPTMEEYESILTEKVTSLVDAGYQNCGFGDIFLEDLKQYRIDQLAPYHIKAHFPLWKRDTKDLLRYLLDEGFKTVLICIKAELLDESFCGRLIDRDFIKDLPSNVDPCGENGEFHTFCYDGPIFKYPVQFELGEKVFKAYRHGSEKTGFWFQDLLIID